jgi:hypothetical protein
MVDQRRSAVDIVGDGHRRGKREGGVARSLREWPLAHGLQLGVTRCTLTNGRRYQSAILIIGGLDGSVRWLLDMAIEWS